MEIRYHRLVQSDLNGALDYYDEASDQLGDDFHEEFMAGISKVLANPKFCHFDACGLRRYNWLDFHSISSTTSGKIISEFGFSGMTEGSQFLARSDSNDSSEQGAASQHRLAPRRKVFSKFGAGIMIGSLGLQSM